MCATVRSCASGGGATWQAEDPTCPAVSLGPGHTVVAWFTDDAGFRWQLDEYQHLVEAADGDVYKP